MSDSLKDAGAILVSAFPVAKAAVTRAAGATVGDTGKLLARIVARDSYELRKVLIPLIRPLNPRGGMPEVW
ncbi:MAG: hypothetical protein ACSHXI_14350 [Hoeflea sp.]|uniref:hypothetical protein n=1 Tax=Hoeflea sp. TaxID=1940281 RepID=UPI003EF33962